MFNIKKFLFLGAFISILFMPMSVFAEDDAQDLGGKSDGDFMIFEDSNELESIDLAIQIFKVGVIEEEKEEKVQKQEQNQKKSDNKQEFSKEGGKMVSYMMSKNSGLSKENAQKIYNSVIKHSSTYGTDPYLVFAIMEQESRFNPNTSYQGAYGLMQLYYTTLPYLGIKMDEVYDIDKNIKAGVKEISGNISMFGNYTTALSAYNWGSGNVKRGTYNTKYANSVLKRKANIESKVK